MRKKARVRMSVLEVEESKQITLLRKKEVHENRVQIGNDEESRVEFSHNEIFNLKIPRKLRKPLEFDVLLHRAGSEKCFTLGDNNLIDPLTNEESANIVKRNIAIGLGKYSPISFRIALILALIGLANLVSILFLILRARVI